MVPGGSTASSCSLPILSSPFLTLPVLDRALEQHLLRPAITQIVEAEPAPPSQRPALASEENRLAAERAIQLLSARLIVLECDLPRPVATQRERRRPRPRPRSDSRCRGAGAEKEEEEAGDEEEDVDWPAISQIPLTRYRLSLLLLAFQERERAKAELEQALASLAPFSKPVLANLKKKEKKERPRVKDTGGSESGEVVFAPPTTPTVGRRPLSAGQRELLTLEGKILRSLEVVCEAMAGRAKGSEAERYGRWAEARAERLRASNGPGG